MSAKIKIMALLTFLLVLALSAGVIYAQDNQNGNGNHGNRYGSTGEQSQVNGLYEPQQNTYNYGGNGNRSGNRGNGAGGDFYGTLPPAVTDELPDAVIEAMVDSWTDEQHAYAVYEAVMNQFGEVRPFVNIQLAEAQHIAAWESLFDRYSIPVPEVPDFGEMPPFDSLAAACQAAADAEIANFELYDDLLATFSEYPDILQVATTLRDASEFNHLPAFQNCAS
jgi:hypothetical protein